jgi:hypothetical protein
VRGLDELGRVGCAAERVERRLAEQGRAARPVPGPALGSRSHGDILAPGKVRTRWPPGS